MIRLLMLAIAIYAVWRFLHLVLAHNHQRNRAENPMNAQSAYAILGVAPDATPEEIRAAYQQLIQQYHPDKVAELGPELQDVALRRTKEINAAYASLKNRR